MKSVQIHVSGQVQGVFFRVYAQKFAHELTDVTGYVRNLPDGRVEIFAEGSKKSLTKVVKWAQEKGSPGSRIIKAVVNWNDIRIREFTDFQITF
ncbi:MAG: acylphosphatase [Candidatus Hodarchaeales archaeon]